MVLVRASHHRPTRLIPFTIKLTFLLASVDGNPKRRAHLGPGEQSA